MVGKVSGFVFLVAFVGLLALATHSFSQPLVYEVGGYASFETVATGSNDVSTPKVSHRLPAVVSTEPPIFFNTYEYSWSYIDDSSKYEDYFGSLSYELSKYPSGYFDDLSINHIYVVRDIETYDGQNVLGFSDIQSGDIFVSAVGKSSVTNVIVAMTIHHEIGHMLSVAAMGYEGLESTAWQSINKDASYNAPAYLSDDLFAKEGFVSDYAQTSVAEDMAEVFACIMNDICSAELPEHTTADRVLAEKVDFIYGLLATVDSGAPLMPQQVPPAAFGE